MNDALRTWRTRRRVSQLALAARAGTTQRHVSFIESGRSAPGRTMIIRLAESLEIPIRERNELLRAAGFAPAYAESDPDSAALSAVRVALERILHGHLPCPAVLVNRLGEVLSANAAFGLLTEGVAAHLLVPPINVPRLLLHPEGLAPRILNLAQWAWHVVDRLQADCMHHPTPELIRLALEMNDLSPPLPDHLDPGYLGLAVPLELCAGDRVLNLVTTITRFGTATDVTVDELRMEAFLPQDEATAIALAELVKP